MQNNFKNIFLFILLYFIGCATHPTISDESLIIYTPAPIRVLLSETDIRLSSDTSTSKEPPDTVLYDKEPVILHRVEPQYPIGALAGHLEGDVLVKAWVNKTGNVRRAKFLFSETTIFIKPSMRAIIQWKFEPALKNGKPIDVWVAVPFHFRCH